MLTKFSLSEVQQKDLQNVIDELVQSDFITQVYQVDLSIIELGTFNFSSSFDAIRFCEKLSFLSIPHNLSVINLTYREYQ